MLQVARLLSVDSTLPTRMSESTAESSLSQARIANEQNGCCTRTKNGMGWQLNQVDEHDQEFIEFAKTAARPILDLGVAFGYSTLALLQQTKAKVVANDLSQAHLDHLVNSLTTDDQRQRLTVKPGNALDLEFPANSFDGVQALRWLHFCTPEEIRKALANFSRWLAPGGKMCITVSTPYIAECAGPGKFLEIYNKRRENKEEWPGYMTKENLCWPAVMEVERGYMFDEEVLQREAARAGFKVDRFLNLSRDFAYTNGKENLGMLATKT